MKKYKLISILLLFYIQGNLFAQTEGPNSPADFNYSAAGCLSCPGGEWQNMNNISVLDGQYADVPLTSFPSCFQSNCYYSRILFATNFGFTIPPGSIIKGVIAEVFRKSTATNGMTDTLVQLYSHSPVGINHASSVLWTPNPANVVYGDSTDNWGYTLTRDSINQPDFGLSIMVKNKFAATSFSTASIDHIQMTVYYNTGTSIESQTKESRVNVLDYNRSTNSLIIKNDMLHSSTADNITSLFVYDLSAREISLL